MASLLRMPEVAAGATEAVLAEWLVPENTMFSAGDPIVVVETEKAIVEVEAEVDALILKTLVAAGTEVEVGSPVALLGTTEETGSDLRRLLSELGIDAPADLEPGTGPTEPGTGPTEPGTGPTEPRTGPTEPVEPDPVPEVELDVPETAPAPEPAPTVSGPTPAPDTSPDRGQGGRVFASPLARQLLRRAGLSPGDVPGTGPNGRIVRRDVERALGERTRPVGEMAESAAPRPAGATAARHPTASRGAAYTEIPHTRMRRAVASRLTQSKQTVPHFYLKSTAGIGRLLSLRAEANDGAAQRISVNDLVIKAVAHAHTLVPEMNVVWTDDALRQYESVDVAIAVASERGLVTPVLRSVETMTLSAVSAGVRRYVEAADAGRLQQHQLEGGSISVTNLGMFGVEEFSAIINPPQSAILAVGAGTPQPVVVDGAVEVATRMALVLSVDHRAVDGALAARWMAQLVAALEHPLQLLL